MPIQFNSFDQQKVDNLKKYLDSFAAKGKPKNYEIFVDGVKVVNKTNDPDEFYNYEDYQTASTNSIKFTIYCSNNSFRNEQYVYALNAHSPQEALDMGLDGFVEKSYNKSDIQDLIKKRDKQRADTEELESLRRKVTAQEAQLKEKEEELTGLKGLTEKQKVELLELEVLKKKNSEQENEITGLEGEIANYEKVVEAQSKKIEKREVDLGKVGSFMLQHFAKSNAGKLAQATGIPGLAGFFSDEEQQTETDQQPQQPQPETEASFKKKGPAESGIQLSEDEKYFLGLFKDLNRFFSPAEMEQLIEIIQLLSMDKSKLSIVLSLLQGK